jgi:hypothetical protein
MPPWCSSLAAHGQAVQEFLTTREGFRLATSNGGVLTGCGANIILIDDPPKPEGTPERIIQSCRTGPRRR